MKLPKAVRLRCEEEEIVVSFFFMELALGLRFGSKGDVLDLL